MFIITLENDTDMREKKYLPGTKIIFSWRFEEKVGENLRTPQRMLIVEYIAVVNSVFFKIGLDKKNTKYL